jgi:hypothetical protein
MEPPALFPSEGRNAADFFALKNPSPLPGLNPRPLGPVTSIQTTTPPRRPRNIHLNVKTPYGKSLGDGHIHGWTASEILKLLFSLNINRAGV